MITTLYRMEIHKLMLRKTATWNEDEVFKIEDRVQCQMCFKYHRPSETFCTCGSIPQGITEEVKKQAEQGINSRFMMYVPGVHNVASNYVPRGRCYGNSAQSQKLKKARDDVGSAKKQKLLNDQEAPPRGRTVPTAHARTRIHAIRHRRICHSSE